MSRVAIVGGGIVGTALAADLAGAGMEVLLISDRGIGGGATAAGMGHLITLDGEGANVALTTRSMELWEDWTLGEECDRERSGTLWIAEDDEEMEMAVAMSRRFETRGIETEIVEGQRVSEIEPELRDGLAGGLVVPRDSVVYPPNVALELWHRARERGAQLLESEVLRVEPRRVELADGPTVEADWVVVAAGERTPALLPGIPIRPKKGHLLITARGQRFVHHQVVELGYKKTTESRAALSVACNVQPRPTGQVLIGSSRQEDTLDPAVESEVLERMLRRAQDFFPRLSELTALRAWTGFRAATPDGTPIIGKISEGLAVATGHEGLGITQAPATARLLRQILLGEPSELDAPAYSPLRFAEAN